MARNNVRAKARGLGAELTDLRTQAGMTIRDVTNRLGWSPPTLSRIENGLRDSTSEEIASLLVVYKITGARHDRLVRLARTIDQPGWWETSATGLPGQLIALRAFEAEATKIAEFGLVLVPGLLQTPGYVRAVMESGRVPADSIDDRVAVRLERQRILDRRDPPEVQVIIDEIVLGRALGGPAVMADQVRHLVRMAARPHIDVRILRGAGHPAVSGSYVILDFPPPAQPFVHLEHYRSSLFLDEPDDVRSFQALTESLLPIALAPGPSQEFLARLARKYEADAREQRDGRVRPGVAQVRLQRDGDRLR